MIIIVYHLWRMKIFNSRISTRFDTHIFIHHKRQTVEIHKWMKNKLI